MELLKSPDRATDLEAEHLAPPPELSTASLGHPKHRMKNGVNQIQRLIAGHIIMLT